MSKPKRTNKVVWLDSASEDSHDPQHWPGSVPHTVRGRLTPTRVKAIRQLYSSGEYTQMELAEMFNTTSATINHIVLRKTWRWM